STMASEIVVGVDFGTTYSGVSWAVNGGNKTVRVINDWPNPSSTNATSDKVPTIISYQNGEPQWGFCVDNVRKDSFRWIKLLLDPKNSIGRSSEAVLTSTKLLGTLTKTAEDVAADYLRMVWKYAKEDIQKVRGDDWESIYTLKCVLTVPAIWSPAAKEKTLKIARMAGLPQNIDLVTEPEAAALAVLKEKNDDDESLKVGDCFVVCDAGGGTVDLISYKIVGLDPLAVEECAVGDGGLCGSVYLDQAFERYIKTIVGEDEWNSIRDKPKKKMMREFESSIKRCYSGDDQEYSVDLQGVEDNPREGIDDDTITLKPYGIQCAKVFDESKGHRWEDRRKSPDGQFRAINQMEWMLEKGDKPPSRREISVKELCKVTYGIKCSILWKESSYRDRATGEKWRDATFDLHVALDSATLHFIVMYKGDPVAHTEAKYKEEF
ncbi:actin-like ATPase domain-containing protein, partial [Amniculicola lignicola CBS 123094]